jgi:hypothetical protein
MLGDRPMLGGIGVVSISSSDVVLPQRLQQGLLAASSLKFRQIRPDPDSYCNRVYLNCRRIERLHTHVLTPLLVHCAQERNSFIWHLFITHTLKFSFLQR